MKRYPPHEAHDSAKLAAMIEAYRTGGTMPPIVACGGEAVCGSHRLAAHDAAHRLWEAGADGWEDSPEPRLDVIELSAEDYRAAADILGVEYLSEERSAADVCEAITSVTDDDTIKAALADQCG